MSSKRRNLSALVFLINLITKVNLKRTSSKRKANKTKHENMDSVSEQIHIVPKKALAKA